MGCWKLWKMKFEKSIRWLRIEVNEKKEDGNKDPSTSVLQPIIAILLNCILFIFSIKEQKSIKCFFCCIFESQIKIFVFSLI